MYNLRTTIEPRTKRKELDTPCDNMTTSFHRNVIILNLYNTQSDFLSYCFAIIYFILILVLFYFCSQRNIFLNSVIVNPYEIKITSIRRY